MFICEYTGDRVSTRYFIPNRKNCTTGTGTYRDLNCAVAALDEKVAKGKIKKETAEKYERWMCEVLKLEKKIKRAPTRLFLHQHGPRKFNLAYAEDVVQPLGGVACRETLQEYSDKVVLNTKRARITNSSSVRPTFVKPDCEQKLVFEWRAYHPRANYRSHRGELHDWRQPLFDAGFDRVDHIMGCRVHSNGVELYPMMMADCGDEKAIRDSGVYSIKKITIEK